MEHINQIIERPQSDVRQYSQDEQDTVAYFFFKLKAVYLDHCRRMMPDIKTENIIKREYAPHLVGFTRPQINRGFDALHIARREYPSDWEFLNIDKVIGLVISPEGFGDPDYVKPAGIHRVFPKLLPNKTAEEKAKAAGEKELARLKDLF
jgi:hypothetical protein